MTRRSLLGLFTLTPVLVLPSRSQAAASAFEHAVRRVSQEGSYVVPLLAGLNTGYAYALAICNVVTGLLSAPNYGYLAAIGQGPTSDPETQLALQAGICGEAQLTYLAIARRFGLPARPVYIWYPEALPDYQGAGIPGHATVEVSYGGSWHWFDPTWGTFYRDPAASPDEVDSLLDVLDMDPAEQGLRRVEYASLLWAQCVQYVGEASIRGTGYGFLDFVHLRVESPLGTVLYVR